ncbi:MAG TPA: serine/threonine-protein kinase [Humisphaera sp.]|jgi:serine/threonine-protein kinase|nr:serine/threonine-protein kinase [Humisphaera sp.]
MVALNKQVEEKPALPKELCGYEVLGFLGQGAASDIYLVSHPQSKQVYALKYVVRKTDKDDRFIEQLETEFEASRLVAHRGLRKCLEFKVNRTFLRKAIDAILVMELMDGSPLETRPPANVLETIDCFIQTGSALQSLHDLGYVHCDLKPNNILRSVSGHVKVIDLGQAAKIGTAKKRIQGTPDYIAPEQVKLLPVTPKTDVYNFGATLYWALTGRNLPTLFTVGKGENSFLVNDRISTPHELNASVPEQLSNLVMECVRLNPVKRPEMTEVIRRLEIMDHAVRRDSQGESTFNHASEFARRPLAQAV